MVRRTFQIVTIIATVALVGCGGSEGFLRHLHGGGHALHHGGHHQDAIAEVIEQLELTPEQHQRLENIHEVIGAYGSEGHGSMTELHDRLVEQFEQGDLEAEEMRTIVDEHLEQIRGLAYGVTDELVALVNSLDAEQRETLSAHFEGEDHEGHDAHGH